MGTLTPKFGSRIGRNHLFTFANINVSIIKIERELSKILSQLLLTTLHRNLILSLLALTL